MSAMQIIFLALVFLAVFTLALVIMTVLSPRPLQSRLETLGKSESGRPEDSNWVQRIVELTGPLAKLSLPAEGWENSQLRIRFMNAGFRNQTAPALYFAAKTLLAIIFPVTLAFYAASSGMDMRGNNFLLLLLLSAAIGYFLPNGLLERRIAYRQREIFESFPDVIDLTTVCVEAGLGLDAALARVSEEMRYKTPIIGEELHLVNLELRAGSTRERALRNLALRTGVEEIDTLVAMLVQSDRFGTSVADSLRVHSDSLRTKRRLRAEEAAAKIPTKLLFPLIFFIFPSLLLVLLGPALIQIYRILLPTLGGD
jgi:tight adherence protein C